MQLIPSEMEVASRYTLFTSLTLFVNTVDLVDTVDMVYTVDMICTVDMVYTVDIVDTAELFGTLIMKSLCRGWMGGTVGSYPLDCYDCNEYSSCSK